MKKCETRLFISLNKNEINESKDGVKLKSSCGEQLQDLAETENSEMKIVRKF